MYADTIAKVLHDLNHPHPTSIFTDPGPGTTIIVDEAGMVATADLHQLVTHAEQRDWRLVLVGDPHQLQAVGRGGMFHELCDTGRTITLDHLHRFTHQWEAAASLQLRAGNPHAIRTYHAHGRIHPGTLTEHLDTITHAWTDAHANGETVSITTTRNDDVHTINRHLQQHRLDAGDLDPATAIHTANGDVVMVGDVIATRRNDRHLRTSTGEAVRNRQRWTITDTHPDGQITITQHHGHGTIALPADYVDQHVELAYATTEHGAQGETTDRAITLATPATTGRGLYVAMTRGRHHNTALVLTDTHDPYDAIDLLETSLHIDRADIPATRQRRELHATIPLPTTTPTRPVEHSDPGIDIDL